MKSISSVYTLLAATAGIASAHYQFSNFIANGTVTGQYQYVRITANHYSNGPVTNVNDKALRCYELDYNASPGQTSTATVQAGATVGIQANQGISHPGYFAAYLSRADPAANSPNAGTGSTWFKIYEVTPPYTPGSRQLTFPTLPQGPTFPIPKALPSGQYLLRVEHIALHSASSYGGAQFYIGCAQLNVVGGGNGNPGPTVSIPGVYTGNEPGILINIYNLPAGYSGYQAPGPAVWRG